MAKEGSVAPKERVNIVYRPATGDAKVEVELPLKLLILGPTKYISAALFFFRANVPTWFL